MKSTNNEQPLVSVIMPTYNHAKFIGKAIDSVLNQTYKNLELIVIDNYSEDDTEKIVDSYEDNRITCLKFRNTGIIAASRNHGIKHSNGEYIAFLDSDDLWVPEKLEKQIKLFQISNETAMVYTRYKTIKDGTISNNIFPEDGRYKSGNIFESLYLRSFVACSSVMVKRSVLDQVGLFSTDPDLIAIEDTDLWLKIALKNTIKCTNDLPLLLYRIQPQGISYGYIQKLRRSLRLKRRYKKIVSNYLFWKSTIFTFGYILKEMFMLQGLVFSHFFNSLSR
jgi:glycosyltransferase involved in cell wall biosynthesis